MGAMSGLHILIVPAWWPSPEQPISGIFWTDYARVFAGAGAKVGVVFPDLVSPRFLGRRTSIPWMPRVLEETLDGVPVVRVRGLHTAFHFPGVQMRRFRRWFRRGFEVYTQRHGRPDILHAMCAIPAGWACTHFDEPPAQRVVLTDQTGPFSLVMSPWAGEKYVRTAMKRAAAVLTVSERSRQQMAAAGIDRPIGICGNPVSDLFLAQPTSEPRPSGGIRALFVGRLVAEKGIRELSEAAVSLGPTAGVDWHFAGDGPLARSIEDRFNAAGMSRQLVMHGHCDRARVAELMGASSFLVLPTYAETFGLAVAEALCMGLPVVTTRGTTCGDFISADDGILAEVADARSLAEALRGMIAAYGSFDRRAIAARAQERFSGEVVAAHYGEVFRKIVGDA